MNKINKNIINNNDDENNSISNLKLAFFLNFSFTIIEFFGGLFTNSIAIMADAVHDFGDSLSLGFAWRMEILSKKGKDEKYSYGRKRFSVLSALISSIILIFGSIYVLFESISRFLNPEPFSVNGVLFLALLGILVNGYGAYKVIKGSTLNEKVISFHLIEDVLGWIGIFIVGIINLFFNLPILDPILSILFTSFILYNVFKNLKNIFNVFMQKVPKNVDINEIKKKINLNKEIKNIHDIHIWSIDGEINIMSCHIVLNKNYNLNELEKLKQKLKEDLIKLKIHHLTIEFEKFSKLNEDDCSIN